MDEIKVGDIVKYKEPMPDEQGMEYIVLENRGDRVLMEAIVLMVFPPHVEAYTAHLEPVDHPIVTRWGSPVELIALGPFFRDKDDEGRPYQFRLVLARYIGENGGGDGWVALETLRCHGGARRLQTIVDNLPAHKLTGKALKQAIERAR